MLVTPIKKTKTEIRTIGKGPNIDEYSKYSIERDEIQKKISARITNEHGIKITRLRIIANFLNRDDDIIQQSHFSPGYEVCPHRYLSIGLCNKKLTAAAPHK